MLYLNDSNLFIIKPFQISKEGFPEVQGLKYNLAERSHFTHPVELAQILSAIEDPIVNANNQSIAEMMEADVIAMQRLQSAISTKPKVNSFDKREMYFIIFYKKNWLIKKKNMS